MLALRHPRTLLTSILLTALVACSATNPPEHLGETEEAITIAHRCVTAADCSMSRNPCTQARCQLGVCAYTIVQQGPPVPCDDHDACTFNDRCVGAVCTGDRELTLLSGNVLPAAEGWIGYASAAQATSQSGNFVAVDTTNLPPQAYAMQGHTLPQGVYATHDLQWELSVQSADHNFGDGSAVLIPDYNGWLGSSGPFGPIEREQMIWFDDTEIGWGDLTQTASINTHVPHVYRLHVTPSGSAELSVDGTVMLTRPSMVVASSNIGFGDQTNDWGVNGRSEIRDVRLVPQPQCE